MTHLLCLQDSLALLTKLVVAHSSIRTIQALELPSA